MKKKSTIFFITLLTTAFLFSFSCASKGKVTSTASSKHLLLEQTTTGVYITVTKEASEDIKEVTITDNEGSYTRVSLEKKSNVCFPWPFAEYNKTYTITADLKGLNSSSKESLSFKVENDLPAAISYTKDYLESKLSLNASGDMRLLKIYTNINKINSVFGESKLKTSILKLFVYSGSHTDEDNAVLLADWDIDLLEEDSLKSLTDGYDIIGHAARFNSSPKELNAELMKKETYFAKASVYFVLDGKYPSEVEFFTKPLITNDTIYTPLEGSKILDVKVDEK
ncbi:MAG: hypothetical protein K5829_12910 [Treponema sp.]|nr:hypothetical protein [Treponema sp.]